MNKEKVLKFGVPISIVTAIVLIDQITKFIIVKTMELGESIQVIKKFFYISSHRNDGAAWSILEGQIWFFYIITVIAIAVMVYLLVKKINKKANPLIFYGLLLALAVTIGNFIDRVLFQEVVDFLDFRIFSYNYPIFNVADMALVIGVGIMMFDLIKDIVKELKMGKEKNNEDESEKNE